MSREFKIPKQPYDKGITIYSKSKITIEPGVTILVGCNGAGKTTLLKTIEETLRQEDVPVISYDNKTEGGGYSMSRAGFYGNIELLATLATGSEGEQIMTNISEKAGQIGGFVRKNRDAKEIWLLFDAVDSGFSVDNVVELKEYLFKTILEDNTSRDVYILCTANAYEMCNGENCVDVNSGKYMRFQNYDEYRTFILKSREKKDKRYNSKTK